MSGSRSLFAGLTIGIALAVAGPAAAENVLRFTGILDAGAATMDPHSMLHPSNKGATKQVYEALLDIDSNLAIVPQLAVAWKPSTRPPGSSSCARTCAFTTARRSPPRTWSSASSGPAPRRPTSRRCVVGIAAVEAIDDHTVRITTSGPDPSLWLKLADVAIMSRGLGGGARRDDARRLQRAREETFASRHANGTGPFMLEAFEPRGDWVLVRNPDWWGTADYPHNIDRDRSHPEGGDAENVAALLDGEIDLLQAPPYSALDQIRRTPGLKLVYRTEAASRSSSVSIRAAPSCARPTSKGAIRSRTSGCARRWPTRSTSSRSSHDSWASSSSLPGCWSPRASTAMRRNWTSRRPTTPNRPGRCSPRPATRTASA